MAKMSKTAVDAALRTEVFRMLGVTATEGFRKINDRQWGVIIKDENGVERYVRVGAIVAEERADKTARELMDEEIEKYLTTQAHKAEVAKASKEKAERDKKLREERKKNENATRKNTN